MCTREQELRRGLLAGLQPAFYVCFCACFCKGRGRIPRGFPEGYVRARCMGPARTVSRWLSHSLAIRLAFEVRVLSGDYSGSIGISLPLSGARHLSECAVAGRWLFRDCGISGVASWRSVDATLRVRLCSFYRDLKIGGQR